MVTSAGALPGQLFKVGNQLFSLVHNNGQAYLTPYNGPPPSQPPLSAAPPTAKRPDAEKTLKRDPTPQHSKRTVQEMLAHAAQDWKPEMPIRNIPGKPIIMPKPSGPGGGAQPRSGGFEVCEICGGFVRDKESLRIHFFYAHKVEFSPEMFNGKNGAPLLCNICKQRFWTYHGLVRHSQLIHGVSAEQIPHTNGVSQKKAKAPKCHICGEKNLEYGITSHLLKMHKSAVRKMIEGNVCFICRKKYCYRMSLRSHALRAHKNIFTQEHSFDAFVRILQSSHSADSAEKPKTVPTYAFKCSRCSRSFPLEEVLMKHYRDTHRNDKEPCPLCDEMVVIGRPLVRHMKSEHLVECSVSVQGLSPKEFEKYYRKYQDLQMDAKRKSEAMLNGESDKENAKKRKVDEEVSIDDEDSMDQKVTESPKIADDEIVDVKENGLKNVENAEEKVTEVIDLSDNDMDTVE
jgi:hypothetical protein